MTFVDTSALFAFLDRGAAHHDAVVRAMTPVLAERSGVTHNYVIVEAEALVHRRRGAVAARRLMEVLSLIEVAWITPELHARAVEAHLADLRRRTSLVDHASFVVMRERGIRKALALDKHFVQAGFTVGP